MPYDFKNKVCLITGASSGIGRATAIKMASLGASLSLCDINTPRLEETLHLCNTSPESNLLTTVDVSSPTACNDLIQQTVTKLGRLDFVFNCAGVNPTAYDLTATTDAYFDTLFSVNVKGTYNLTRAAIPHLVHPGSSIINVSSIMGITASAQYAIYCATKWAIVGFTKAMALELGGKGVRVNAVAPGYIDTPTNAGVVAGREAMEKQAGQVAMGRFGTAGEVADVVAYLFSDEARYVNGSIVEVSGGRM